ncbi:MAG TPA: hypothetical protein VIH12_05380, partial [Solibacillus sp.]
MSTVVAQPYSTAGNGGRKLVRLSNGWLVAATRKTDVIYFYVSKDEGLKWNPLTAINYVTIDDNDFSIVANGVNVHIIYGWQSSSSFGLASAKFDATTVGLSFT